MFITILKTTFDKLKCTMKDFLWGFQAEGGWKLPLLAQKRITRPKSLGGPGLKDPKTQANTLLAKWFTNALTGPHPKWFNLLQAYLSSTQCKNSAQLRCSSYSISNRILFGEINSIKHMPYTLHLWRAWSNVHLSLTLDLSSGPFPSHWIIEDVNLTPIFRNLIGEYKVWLVYTLSRLGIKSSTDLWSLVDDSWHLLQHPSSCLRTTSLITVQLTKSFITLLQISIPPNQPLVPNCKLLKWLDHDNGLNKIFHS